MRILFDTNVLISAFIVGGVCYEVVDDAIDEHQLYYTTFIIHEFKEVFKNDFGYPKSVIDEFVAFITKFFIRGDTAGAVEKICQDPDDDQILADALTNRIETLITGDKDLLDLKSYKGIKIISPVNRP